MNAKRIGIICGLLLATIALPAQELKPFKSDNGKYGYKDDNGNIVIVPKYDGVEGFSEGLAAVNIGGSGLFVTGGKWGFVDITGKEVIPIEFEKGAGILKFSEGLALVKRNNKYGFIDKTGKVVIPFQYELAEHFKNGKARVFLTKGGIPFYINKAGEEVNQ